MKEQMIKQTKNLTSCLVALGLSILGACADSGEEKNKDPVIAPGTTSNEVSFERPFETAHHCMAAFMLDPNLPLTASDAKLARVFMRDKIIPQKCSELIFAAHGVDVNLETPDAGTFGSSILYWYDSRTLKVFTSWYDDKAFDSEDGYIVEVRAKGACNSPQKTLYKKAYLKAELVDVGSHSSGLRRYEVTDLISMNLFYNCESEVVVRSFGKMGRESINPEARPFAQKLAQ